MRTPMRFTGIGFLVVAAGFILAAPGRSRAEAPAQSKDDAVEELLKKVEDKEKKDAPKADAKRDSKSSEKAKPGAEAATAKPDAKAKTGGELSTKDKDLDSLLEKLGTTEDARAPDDKKPPGGGSPMPDESNKPGDEKSKAKKADLLSGRDKDIDDHIADLAGRCRKKKEGGKSEENGPLSDVIKQMREVEKKLGEEETGEETRKKQSQIVKRLETLIEEMRSSQPQNRSRSRSLAMKPGQKPGNQPGENPGSNPGHAPPMNPGKPTNKKSLAGGKDEWGHLPPELRQEMDNVMHEEALPSREDLVRRYYLSVSKKSLKRAE